LFGEEESKFKPKEDGDYYVETIINGMECTGKSETYTFTSTDIRIVENDGIFKISPNPFDDILMIDNYKSLDINNIKVMDLHGKTVKIYTGLDFRNKFELNLNDLSVGEYILRIETNNIVVTQKIIKN